jgi:hypothetical protein
MLAADPLLNGYVIPAEFKAQWQEEHTLVLDLELTAARKVSSLWVT